MKKVCFMLIMITVSLNSKAYYPIDGKINSNAFLVTNGPVNTVVVANQASFITIQPINQLDCEGASVNFNVTASGIGLTYTWLYKKPLDVSYLALPLSKNVTYPSVSKITLANVGSAEFPDGTQFQVIVSDGIVSETSSVATLSVNSIVSITASPTPSPLLTNIIKCYGASTSYTVITSYPSNVVAYQWKKLDFTGSWLNVVDGIHYSGAKAATLNISNGTPNESGYYRVYITFNNSTTQCSTDSSSRTRLVTFLPLLTIPQTIITQPSCFLPTGTIAVTIQSLTDVYSYDNGLSYQATNIKSGLVSGTYKVMIKNIAGCLSAVTSVQLDASITSTWNGLLWSPRAPTLNDKIIFAGSYIATQNLAGCSCEVKSGDVVFLSNKILTLTTDLIITGGSLTFEDSASLVQINNGINSGNITYKRTTSSTISNFDYTYWSSPVSPQTLYDVSPTTFYDKFYSFDGSSNNWFQQNSSTLMTKGIGYIIRGPQNFAAPSPPGLYQASFIGVPNNGPILIPITTSTPASYLLGNPYPSALDADTFIQNNPILDGTLYFWTHNTAIGIGVSNPGSGVYAYSGDDYASYNLTGGAGTGIKATSANNLGSFNIAIPSGKIGSGQGFFATATTSGSVIFDNSMRVGAATITGDNSQFFKLKSHKSVEVIEKNRLWLDLFTNEGVFKQLLIGYITGATNEIDGNYDGESFDGKEYVDFYSIESNKNLVIQGRALPFDENDKIPLGYKTTINGDFTIAIDKFDGFFKNQEVFIEDKVLHVIQDLKKESYTFNTVSGTFNDRFVLFYSNKNLAIDKNSAVDKKVLITSKNNQIKIITSDNFIASVLVYDLSGKLVYSKKNNNSNECLINALHSQNTILLVKVNLQNGQIAMQKIMY